MSYVTEYSPCGHHVSKLSLIARTKTDSEHPKSLRIFQCECGKIYMEMAGMPGEMSKETLQNMVREGLAEEVKEKRR